MGHWRKKAAAEAIRPPSGSPSQQDSAPGCDSPDVGAPLSPPLSAQPPRSGSPTSDNRSVVSEKPTQRWLEKPRTPVSPAPASNPSESSGRGIVFMMPQGRGKSEHRQAYKEKIRPATHSPDIGDDEPSTG